jgi:phosphatidylserine/phosphatidylglycerophosphate/cardiolipin synthase-like enzyme
VSLSDEQKALLELVHVTVQSVDAASLDGLAASLEASGQAGAEAFLRRVPQPATRGQLTKLLARWRRMKPQLAPGALAWALRGAQTADQWHREHQSLELVWTGPAPETTTLRRADQALLDVVREAQRSLVIVSFAVHLVPNLLHALRDALARGVSVRLIFETSQETDEFHGDPLQQLPADILAAAGLLVWPRRRRVEFARKQHSTTSVGVLHAKFALADRRLLLVSSANFTGRALFGNVELGVLIRGGQLPIQIEEQVAWLISSGELEQRPAPA